MNRPCLRFFATSMLMSFMLAHGHALAAPPIRDDDPVVSLADPGSAKQGETRTIRITGENFAPGATVRYLVAGTKDNSQITVLSTTYVSETALDTEIQVLETATVSGYDIEVKVGRRKGKGTTLFSVESSGVTKGECSLSFIARFADDSGDGLRSDAVLSPQFNGVYSATGGPGFRLDTNGSMKGQTKKDERKIVIDFIHDLSSAARNCDAGNPQNPEWATGFCAAAKGVDMRIEHQVQFRPGLCSLEWNPEASTQFMFQAVVVNFQADEGGNLIDPDRKGPGPEPLVLNYGCVKQVWGSTIEEQPYFQPDWQALVERTGESEYRISGHTACLHTQLGVLWGEYVGAEFVPIPIEMPFELILTVVDTN